MAMKTDLRFWGGVRTYGRLSEIIRLVPPREGC
jgi:hypothetical protein